MDQYLIGELPEEEHEVKDVREELGLPDQMNMILLAVPVVLGIVALIAYKYRHLILSAESP